MEAAPSRSNTRDYNGRSKIGVANGTSATRQLDGANSLCEENEAKANGDSTATDVQRLFVFSAKTEKSLTSYLSSFQEYLEDVPESSDLVRELSYTLGQRRTHHAYRFSAVASTIASLESQLSANKPSRVKDHVIAFVFTGQGAQ